MAHQELRAKPTDSTHPGPKTSTPRGPSNASFRVFGEAPPFRTPGVRPARALSRENRTDAEGRGLGSRMRANAGKARTGILLWLIGVPIPVILLIWLVRGCV